MIDFKKIIRHGLVGGTRYFDLRGFRIRNEMEAMQKSQRYQHPLNLIPYGKKMYSQNDEDGIINEIFNRIGTTNKTFVELGCGNGLENNTYALLFQNWNGLWIDGSQKNMEKIKKGLPKTILSQQLKTEHAFITKENINDLITQHISSATIDLLSIDLDGNDAHIFDVISCIDPRVVIIEYNARFIPPVKYCMKYKPNFRWDWSDHGGASLSYLEEIAEHKGYSLVGCNLSGVNAFFIKKELADNKFESPFSAEKHYEPGRPYLAAIKSGHPASFQTLEDRIINQESLVK